MNNMQLLISAGFPTIAVLVGILLNQVQITRIDNRINLLEQSITGRFNLLEQSITGRFAEVNARFDKMTAVMELIQRDQREFYSTQRTHDLRLDTLEGKPGDA